MNRLFLLALAAPTIFASCGHFSETHKVAPPVEQPPPLSPDRVRKVRIPETVKSYVLGRYVDPHNSKVLHESHPIYRVETSPRWHQLPGSWLSSDHRANAPKADIFPQGDKHALQQELEQQRLATRHALAGREQIENTITEMSEAIERTKGLAEENAALKARLMERQSSTSSQKASPNKTPEPPKRSLHDWIDSFDQP